MKWNLIIDKPLLANFGKLTQNFPRNFSFPIFQKLIQNRAFSPKMVLKEFRAWNRPIFGNLVHILDEFPRNRSSLCPGNSPIRLQMVRFLKRPLFSILLKLLFQTATQQIWSMVKLIQLFQTELSLQSWHKRISARTQSEVPQLISNGTLSRHQKGKKRGILIIFLRRGIWNVTRASHVIYLKILSHKFRDY